MKKVLLLLFFFIAISLTSVCNSKSIAGVNSASCSILSQQSGNGYIYVKVSISGKNYIYVYLSDGITLVNVYEEED